MSAAHNKIDSQPTDPLIIAVEGNISVGKSTFCQEIHNSKVNFLRVLKSKNSVSEEGEDPAGSSPSRAKARQILPSLSEYIGKKKIHCQEETINRDLLELFYSNQKKYAFCLQMNTMRRRIGDLAMLTINKSDQIIALDRSMIGDFVFAIKHLVSGNINPAEFRVYLQETKSFDLKKIVEDQKINNVVYLHSTPSISRKNVNQRGAVDKDVKEDYLDDIDLIYFYMILYITLTQKFQVYILDWKKFGKTEEISDNTRSKLDLSKIDNKHESPVQKNGLLKFRQIINNIQSRKYPESEFGKDMPQIQPSFVTYYDEKTYEADKHPKIIMQYNDQVLEPMRESTEGEGFCMLDKKFCVRHTAKWRNELVENVDKGLHVYLKVDETKPRITFMDYLDTIGIKEPPIMNQKKN